ncbi:hypothetical protein LZ32DRAFT_600080 [Colletotrichum eremochloae]|nr:hypothetical protein LZ32DRAFT_600080 [Colletotrichum eremochloae]
MPPNRTPVDQSWLHLSILLLLSLAFLFARKGDTCGLVDFNEAKRPDRQHTPAYSYAPIGESHNDPAKTLPNFPCCIHY